MIVHDKAANAYALLGLPGRDVVPFDVLAVRARLGASSFGAKWLLSDPPCVSDA
ncbi:hypothetical protein AB0D60_10315 [Streptomyces sp. NPDC048306]|uniref:hypothetical protein n=1 Tax=Streptomyces sp. NPDC048306 TaxID=3154502 RepID=UPI0034011866